MAVIINKEFSWLNELKNQLPQHVNNPNNDELKRIKIGIVNLMPNVEITERQWVEALSYNENCLVEIVFFNSLIYTTSKIDKSHFTNYYENWQEYDFATLDGLLITGAPVELQEFKDVYYYDEICHILDKAQEQHLHMFLVCWAAQAALNYFYQVPIIKLEQKISGVYEHNVAQHRALFNGCDDFVTSCVSRQTKIDLEQALPHCNILLQSIVDGSDLLEDKNNQHILYMSNHLEYDDDTLHNEYIRDLDNPKVNAGIPENYYTDNDPSKGFVNTWKDDKIRIMSNWVQLVMDTEKDAT